MRNIEKHYSDPLDLIWIHAANQMGMKVERDPEVFASWDGKGTLRIGTRETLDPDDSLAQMVFHETCHALVEGPEALGKEDWGLANAAVHEHACLVLQSALADQFGLRQFFAATTDFRRYFDLIPTDPFSRADDVATEMALAGWDRAKNGPWSEALNMALIRTRAVADAVAGIAASSSLWSLADN